MHAEAHAQDADGGGSGPEFTGHPLIPQGKPTLITEQSGLEALLDHLRSAGRFAYDSEFIGELTYVPKLCLVQVATGERVALVDPLADVDLTPFWELVCDPAIEKIVHAGEQDIEPVIRLTGQRPRNVFDTQIVAGFAEMAYPVSLQKLVHAMLGYKLGKGLTFTHWDQRPLSAMQLRYAADDVRYLPAVHAELVDRVESLGYMAWAREECDAQCDPDLFKADPATQFLKIRGAVTLSRTQLGVLRALYQWRDATARAEDIPPRALLRDEILMDMARSPIKSRDAFARVKGLPRPVEDRYAGDMLAVTTKVLASPPTDLPEIKNTDENPSDRFQIDALYAAVQCLCFGKSMDPAVVTSRQQVADLYRRLRAHEDVSDHPIMVGWRREAAGAPLMEMVRGKSTATLQFENGALRTR
jgi:ribonuclease D